MACVAGALFVTVRRRKRKEFTVMTNAEHWTVEGLPWNQLDPSKVKSDTLRVIKAAALVEYNADTYADYLCRVFKDDPQFCADARRWAVEEVQHGKALGAWAEKMDPSWNFERAMARFRKGYTPEHFLTDTAASVRGTRAGEMVARCMVETGTSSYYSAIGDAVDEPVLKEICKNIAADEFKHYKLFYDTLNRYLEKENLSRVQRLRVALGRIAESEDDELSYAYYAANAADSDPYDRKTYNKEYVVRAYSFYQPKHLDRVVAMIFKACGFKPHSAFYNVITRLAWWKIESASRRMRKMAA